MCLLTRSYADGAEKAELGFRLAPGDDQVEVVLLRFEQPTKGWRRGSVSMSFGADKLLSSRNGVSLPVPNTDQRLLRFFISRSGLETLGKESAVTIEEHRQPPVAMTLTSAGKAVAALRKCESDQIRGWGIDPDMLATRPVPIGDMSDWYAYPLRAASEGQHGETIIRWRIATDGRAKDCAVLRSSGNSVLDSAACEQLVARGRYRPAIAKSGKPMDWFESRRIVWSIAPIGL
ncbi:energy transducer TonB [Sphingomonas japonica]|uniref:TonB family protein n=1 Tax=Sphingomonas japonica TaxID=511662 RepID=A0ABX0U151_9SPHN|nr:energy transducer TonB [Sphingomonas japonica]NIJ24249.1 TonB family protein [Sphingomonas japonica]